MAAGDIKKAYASSSALTQTLLDALASDTSHVAGWESGAIDNSTNLYLDYVVNAKVQVGAAPTAGEIRMYFVAELEDASWPDVFDGTQSAETVTSAEIRDAICVRGAAAATNTSGNRVYFLACPSVAAIFGGTIPRKFVVFITHSTVQALAGSGASQVYVKGVYETVAP